MKYKVTWFYLILGMASFACEMYWISTFIYTGSIRSFSFMLASILISYLLMKQSCDSLPRVKHDYIMSYSEFVDKCTLSSGKWSDTLLSGVQSVFPDSYDDVKVATQSIIQSQGDIYGVKYICDWLKTHGISFDNKGEM